MKKFVKVFARLTMHDHKVQNSELFLQLGNRHTPVCIINGKPKIFFFRVIYSQFRLKKNVLQKDRKLVMYAADCKINHAIEATLLEKFRNVLGNFWATNDPNFYQ